jgi:hypothetical protein
MILVDVANGKQRHVPYRDSKLTFLLQVNALLISLQVLVLLITMGQEPDSYAPMPKQSADRDLDPLNVQDSLGGNSKTTIIATVSPASWCVPSPPFTLFLDHQLLGLL